MAEIDKWRNYSSMLNFPRPENAEKDFLQELLLKEIYAKTEGIVFRGGTALSKFYGSGRFSEDLDFVMADESYTKRVENVLSKIEAGIKNVGNYFKANFCKTAYKDMFEYSIRIEGPLFVSSGNPAALQKVSIDLNSREIVSLKPRLVFRNPMYENMRNYTILVEELEELLADKVKALIERHAKRKGSYVRDLYDIWSVLKKYDTKINLDLVREKMQRYGKKEFSLLDFKTALKDAKDTWEVEISAVMRTYPTYDDVKSTIEKKAHL